MTTPIEEAEAILAEDQAMKDWPSAQRGGARLQSHPRLLDVLSRLLAYHVGYRQAAEQDRCFEQGQRACDSDFLESTNGEPALASRIAKG